MPFMLRRMRSVVPANAALDLPDELGERDEPKTAEELAEEAAAQEAWEEADITAKADIVADKAITVVKSGWACLVSEEAKRYVMKTTVKLCKFGAYMLVGSVCFVQLEEDAGWSYIDAAYFSMATMSTVGYGDIFPSSDASRIFTLLMIFVGIIFVFTEVADLISDFTNPLTRKGRIFLEWLWPQVPLDLDGDGDTDIYVPRHHIIYYSKNLIPSILLTMAVQCMSAVLFTVVIPEWSFGAALYHCIVTATTVGYGDMPNGTQAGRLLSCFHILVSVCLLGEIISTFDALKKRRQATMAKIKQLSRELDLDL